jgi:hypothetical protein
LEIKVKENLATIVLTVVVLFCVFKTAFREVDFRHLNISDGLSQHAVFAILQDSKEIVWIDSYLLIRWDREKDELKSYEPDSYNPDDFGNVDPWKIIQFSNSINKYRNF